jgi:hypothetical protein
MGPGLADRLAKRASRRRPASRRGREQGERRKDESHSILVNNIKTEHIYLKLFLKICLYNAPAGYGRPFSVKAKSCPMKLTDLDSTVIPIS